MVQLMLEGQSDKKHSALFSKDLMEMSPLHTAALFDHADIAEYLIDQVIVEFIGIL